MSYTDVVSRISQLDALIRTVDPDWGGTGLSMSSVAGTAISSSSPFSSVLQGYATAASSPYVSPSVIGQAAVMSNSYSGVVLSSPLPGATVTQNFGPSTEPLEPSATYNGVTYEHFHNGIDLARPLGTPVLAAAGGTVTMAGKASDGAVVVKIRHDNGYTTLYGHLDPSLAVSVGQKVTAGQTLGNVGMTGATTGPHLHFGLYDVSGAAVDPAAALSTGRMPDPASLMAPSPTDPNQLVQTSGAAVLARYDAVSSKLPAYAAEIRAAAIANGIDPLLLASVVRHESNFHPTAVSSCGARGLTQLMPGTAAGLGVTDSFDVNQNLNGGAKYIAKQLKAFGRVDMALSAYNAGPGLVGRLGAVADGTRPYIARILATWQSYQQGAA